MAETTHHQLKRTATSDADLVSGRYALLGATKVDEVMVQASVTTPISAGGSLRGGVLCRYLDAKNWLMLVRNGWVGVVGTKPTWSLLKRVGGAEPVTLASGSFSGTGTHTIGLLAGANGTCRVFIDEVLKVTTAVDADLTGTLASGYFGLYDAYTAGTALTRYYDAFRVWGSESEYVLAPNQSLRVDDGGAERYDTTGAYLAPVAGQRGRGLTLPCSGSRKRSVRVIGKTRAFNLEDSPSSLAATKHRLLVTYKPRYRFPRSA